MSAKIIAIDYDGTIALNSYPQAGEPNWPVIARAKAEQAAGARLVLWTCREGAELDIALAACAEWGLTFEAVNDHLPDMKAAWGNNPRKVFADEYWDDHAAGVVFGRWEDGVCTACGFDIRDLIDGESDFRNWVWKGLPYCPNCGVKMED